jgi:putative SOS response-associated peptidase YedK
VCGRYVSTHTPADLAELLGAVDDTAQSEQRQGVVAPVEADYNVAPTKSVPAVLERGGTRRLVSLRWGLVPSWAKNPSGGARLINARAETVASKPAFRAAFARRRCLLPADGWYEWEPARAPKAPKQPYFLAPADGGLLVMAGLYEIWVDAEGRPLWSTTVLTTDAPDDTGHIHDRSPMSLPPDEWDAWLDPATPDPLALLRPAVAGAIRVTPVSTEVNSVRNNGPQLLAPTSAGTTVGRARRNR